MRESFTLMPINKVYSNNIDPKDPLNINISYNSQNSINKVNNSDKLCENSNEDNQIPIKSFDINDNRLLNFGETSNNDFSANLFYRQCYEECSPKCPYKILTNNNIDEYTGCVNKCKNETKSCQEYCRLQPENDIFCKK
jgi:hypothetical protein